MITPGGRVGDSSPLGHKGKRRVLDDYVRSVAHALMREHGIPKGHAIAIAKNSLKRWARGGGHVRPQVRAGAAAHLGVQKALDSRHLSLATPIGGTGEGPRATLPAMTAGGRKVRPGSIPSGKGKGKFPITDQQSVKSAASLLHKAKGVSRQAVIAHVRAEAKRRGLKLTPAFQPKGAKNLTALPGGGYAQVVDLVGPKGYSHGWIKATGGDIKRVPRGGLDPEPKGSKAALTPFDQRNEAQHAEMRARAVVMHGPVGGEQYDKIREQSGVGKSDRLPTVHTEIKYAGGPAVPLSARLRGDITKAHDNQVRALYRHGDAKHHHMAKAELTRRGLSHPRESDYQQYVNPSATPRPK